MSTRDIFEEIFPNQPLDPTEAARRALRPRRRRFYKTAGTTQTTDGFAVLLDGRPVRTPAGRPLVAPTQPLAEALAAEWAAQEEFVDPAAMPITRLANSVVDGVAHAMPAVAEEVSRYLRSDLLFYRADGPDALLARQARHWDPVLDWADTKLGARFILMQGVMFVEQPQQAVEAARAAIPYDPWRLGALHAMTTLTGSALLALAVLRCRLSAKDAWAAAHVDEDWQMEQWGGDELALKRRAFRRAEMESAAAVLRLLG